MKQKFKKGDHVMIAKNLGESMSHFTSDCEAIVMYTYGEKYGGDNYNSYCIYIKDHGECSWYYECQLDLIEPDRNDLLSIWKNEEEKESSKKSNLDWIFENGNEVLINPHNASIESLAKCFDLDNLWGSHGEGMTYYANATKTLSLASPFLLSGDKKAWLEFCKSRLTHTT